MSSTEYPALRNYQIHTSSSTKAKQQRSGTGSNGSIRILIKEANDILHHGIKNSKIMMNQNNDSLNSCSSQSRLSGPGSGNIQMKIQSTKLFRIMGRVIHIQHEKQKLQSQTSNSTTFYTKDDDEYMKFKMTLDDGTSTIDIMFPHSHEFSSNHDNDKNLFHIGECIDCVGILQNVYCYDNMNNDDSGGNHGARALLLESVSKVHDPNLETLRMIELGTQSWDFSKRKEFLTFIQQHHYDDSLFIHYQSILSNGKHKWTECRNENWNQSNYMNVMTHQPQKIQHQQQQQYHEQENHRINMYGNLISNYVPFQTITNINTPPQSLSLQHQPQQLHVQKLSIDRDQLLHYIELSKPRGLHFDDLMLLFDCQTMEEIQALKDGLQMIQKNGEIYININNDCYMPL